MKGHVLRMCVTEVLIDHQMALEERRAQRTAESWPDESDIYATTFSRLQALFEAVK